MQLQARLQLRGLPSSLSDLGSESRVLLPDGSVVLQDPLQVGHSFVTVFCLDLWKTTAPEVSGSRWEVLKVQTLVNHPSTLQMKPGFIVKPLYLLFKLNQRPLSSLSPDKRLT